MRATVAPEAPLPKLALSLSTRRFFAALALLMALSAAPRAARSGGALTWFGNEARSASMGGAGAATGQGGPAQLLVNPALMSFHAGGVWATFSACPSFLEIRLKERPPGYDVPDAIYQSKGWGRDRPVPTSLLTNARGDTAEIGPTMLLSIAVIGSLFHDDLRVGLGFTTPLPSMMTVETWYNDEREQHFSNRLHFERFGEFDSAMTFYPGISFAPVDWFSAGMTLQIDLAMALDSRIFLTDSIDWEYSYLNTGGRVYPQLRPIAGIAFRTPFGLGFGAVYRFESYTDVQVDIDMRVWGGERETEDGGLQKQFRQSHRNVFGYKPHEIALAASFERGRLAVEATGTLELWSRYLDRHGNDWTQPTVPVVDVDPETPGNQPGVDPVVAWKDPTFKNAVSARLGAEVAVTELFSVRAGAAFFPSPMPSQTGRYSYVDNELLMYSLGAGFRFRVLGRTVTADVAAQLWQMLELDVTKSRLGAANGGVVDEVPGAVLATDDDLPLDEGQGLQTNNPGFPGYTLGGFALNLALTLGVEFD